MAKTRRIELAITAIDADTALVHTKRWDENSVLHESDERIPANDVPDHVTDTEYGWKTSGYFVIVTKYEPFSKQVRQMMGLAPL